MNTILLFSYGTLSDPQYIQLLLKRLPNHTEALLPGYELLIHPANGYLFVKPNPETEVKGYLLEISATELQLIDLWEDVPLYEREQKMVITKNGETTKAFVYTQNATRGLPFSNAGMKNRKQVLQEIDDFLLFVSKSGYFR